MRHWTQDSAHGAALLSVCSGMAGLGLGHGWAAFATLAAGLLVLAILRALESRDGWKQASEALFIAQGVRAELDAVKKDAEEARKQAVSARNEANARPARAPVHTF